MSILTEPLHFVFNSPATDMATHGFANALSAHRRVFGGLEVLQRPICDAGDRLAACLSAGGKLLLCGNGGSAATAHHLAADLAGRFAQERRPLAALALAANTPALTGIGDTYGFDEVYARQVSGLGRAGDALLVLSAGVPGASLSNAVKAAKDAGLLTVGLFGLAGSAPDGECHLTIRVPDANLARVQEAHLFIGHVLCSVIESALGLSQG